MGVAESVRVAAAAAGVFVTLAVVLITVAVVKSCAAPTADEDPGASELLSHLSLLYKGTYVIYGNGVSRLALLASLLSSSGSFFVISLPERLLFTPSFRTSSSILFFQNILPRLIFLKNKIK